MQLLQPLMLAYLGLIPVLIVIHFLKPKSKPIEVANLFLWQTVITTHAAQIRFYKLKKNLPLLLQILIIIFLALALSQPVLTYISHPVGNQILVIDTSASMKTRRAAGTRFDRAVDEALEILSQLTNLQKALIIEAGFQPKLVSGFLEDADRAKALIKDIRPNDAPADLKKALTLAISFLDPSRDDRIHLITDGAGGDIWTLLNRHPKIVPVLISDSQHNIGITNFVFRKQPVHGQSYEILLEIRNYSPLPKDCPVKIFIDETEFFKARFSLDAEEKKQIILPYSGLITGIAKAVIDVEDSFAVDNRAHVVLRAAADIWVLLVSKGNYFLENLLASFPNLKVNKVEQIIPSSWHDQTQKHDIVIVDRLDAPPTERGNLILIDALSPAVPAQRTGQIRSPKIVDWDKRSPLLADIEIAGLRVEKAAALEMGKGLNSVVESLGTDLIAAYEKANLRVVLINFDITRSDLPIRIAFPALFSNIINWFNPHRLDFSALQTRAGESIDLYTIPETKRLFVRPPGGRWETHLVSSNPTTFSHTEKTGIYTLKEGNRRSHFAVNLLNAVESDIRSPVIVGDGRGAETVFIPKETTAGLPLWPLFVSLALMVLMMEWYIWLKYG